MGILPFLGDHLTLLHLADALVGEEDDDLRARHIRESFQGRLARIAGSSGQDADLLIFVLLLRGRSQKIGQNGQGHVLEGRGPAVVQFEEISLASLCKRNDLLGLEFIRVSAVGAVGHFFICVVIEEGADDGPGNILVGLAHQVSDLHRQRGDPLRNVEALVLRDSLDDGLGRCLIVLASSCTLVHDHMLSIPPTVSTILTISSTSARAPLPTVPQASMASFGSMIW